jgi:PPOX class probable F420-dependent enzyme
VELMAPSLDAAARPPALTTIDEGPDTGQRDPPSMATVLPPAQAGTAPHRLWRPPVGVNRHTNRTVDLAELLDFARPRHRLLLATTRRDGRPQISPVSGGVDLQGRIVISTYPARAKTRNAERDPRVSVLVLSDDWNGPWVQVDGDAEVLHMPDAADGLVDYSAASPASIPTGRSIGRPCASRTSR